MNTRFKTALMVALCCVFLAACADSCGSDDMSESSADQPVTAEGQAEGSAEMDDDMDDGMDESSEDEMAEMDDSLAMAVAEGEGDMEEAAPEVERIAGNAAAMATAPIELVPGEVELPDYGWKLLWFGSNEINQEVKADVTLRFAPGTLAGKSGCNQYTGSFESPGDHQVKVGELATTRMACPEETMAVEQRYLTMLRSVSRYEFKKDGLYLYDAAGDWLHFQPEAPAED